MPIQKTSLVSDTQISSQITDPVLRKRLEEQNIWEVLAALPGEYTKEDILDYLRMRYEQLVDLVQDKQVMAVYAEAPQINYDDRIAPPLNQQCSLSNEDLHELANMLSEAAEARGYIDGTGAAASHGRFAVAGDAQGDGLHGKMSKEAKGKVPTPDELTSGAEAAYNDATALLDELEEHLFNVQMRLDLQGKDNELRTEIHKLLALARSGKIDAVWILIALAKATALKSGVLFSSLGKKMTRLNMESDKVVQELAAKNPSDPSYFGTQQIALQRQREAGTQQQFIVQDMQRLMQNIESSISFAKTSMDEIFKTRLNIVNAVKGSGY